jgi:hypothetical protein
MPAVRRGRVTKEENMVNMQEVRRVAKDLGLKTGGISKMKIIHSIQRREGNFDCFASAVTGECDQPMCRWREDCFVSARKLQS